MDVKHNYVFVQVCGVTAVYGDTIVTIKYCFQFVGCLFSNKSVVNLVGFSSEFLLQEANL